MFVISFFWKATHLIDVDIQQSLSDPSKKGGCIGPAAHIPKFVNASVESLLCTEKKIKKKKTNLKPLVYLNKNHGVRNTTAAKPKKVGVEEIHFHILKLDNTSWIVYLINGKQEVLTTSSNTTTSYDHT
ncbi:hypothetical protein RUM44_009101 [Polyplax serrata]|uniref:Uncharacterized protein n=1 Tax=Polyplax serrata TaxID=468196 RepID=A0ABR1ARQ0_POLSC